MASFTDVTTLPAGSFDQYEEKGNLAQLILDGAQGYLNYKKGESDKKAAADKAAEAETRKRSLEDRKLDLDERRVKSAERKDNATIASLTGTKKTKKDKLANLKAITAALEKFKTDSLSKIKSLTDEKNAVSKKVEFGSSEEAVAAAQTKTAALDEEITAIKASLESNSKEWKVANRNYINALKGVEDVKKDPKSTPKAIEKAESMLTEAGEKVRNITMVIGGAEGVPIKAGGPQSPSIPLFGDVTGTANKEPNTQKKRKPLSLSIVGNKDERGGLAKDEFSSLPPAHQSMIRVLNEARSRRKNRGL